MNDDLKRAVLAALGPKPTPPQRRRIAAVLRGLADEQDQIADAAAREQARPAKERVGARKRGAGPGRAPSRFVRIEREESGRLHLYVGRGLYYELGSPKRLDVQRLDIHIILSVADGGAGLRGYDRQSHAALLC